MFILLMLGFVGYRLFRALSLPSPAVLGSIIFLGFLRVLDFPLPEFPSFFFPFIQIVLGLFIGAKITREALREIKSIYKPSVIIVIWTIGLIFFMGFFITGITHFNIHTAILSSTMGGLPEMMVLALATEADISFVILMHSFRLLLTLILFPLLFNYWMGSKTSNNSFEGSKTGSVLYGNNHPVGFKPLKLGTLAKVGDRINDFGNSARSLIGDYILLLTVGGVGGLSFIALGVPAGGMIGAMFLVALFSMFGINFKPLPVEILIPVQISVGALATGSISRATVQSLFSMDIFGIVIFITFVTFGSSLLVALILYRTMKWDFPTSFLAAAPGGFAAIMVIAVQYNLEPVKLSMLHLCRLVIIKLIIPLFYMLYN